MKLLLMLFAVLLLQACAPMMNSQNYVFGKRDFANGDFKHAFHELLPAASDGKPEAEYAIGYMYYYGYGAPIDNETGIFWMEKAAEQHYPPAIKALELIHSEKARNDKLFVKT